jgi:deoxyribonuclease-4
MWRASPPSAVDCALLDHVRDKLDLRPLVIHVNYLINLASIDPDIRSKSIAAFRGELERAELIGAEYLVAHPGSYKNQTVADGIVNFAHGVAEASHGLKRKKVMLLIECTAGGGCHLGSRFEELHSIRDLAATLTDLPVGYCLDTCHLFSAGFDIRTEAGLNQTMRDANRTLGAANIKVIHANDSKGAIGSHLDRHENIGQGQIGEEAFRRILAHPTLSKLPFILETPVDKEGDDIRNLETLKKLYPRKRTSE